MLSRKSSRLTSIWKSAICHGRIRPWATMGFTQARWTEISNLMDTEHGSVQALAALNRTDWVEIGTMDGEICYWLTCFVNEVSGAYLPSKLSVTTNLSRSFITNDWMDYIIEMAHDEKQNRGRGRSRFRDDGTTKRVAFKSRPSIIGRNHQSCSQSEGMPVYHLGEVLRSQDHAMASGPKNTEMAKMLEEHDCAFIKRSDSGWTYSILAYRISPTFGEHDCDLHCDGDVLDDDFNKQNVDTNEEVMLFVLDKMGRTKAIRSSSYGKYIRCVTEMPDKNIEVKEAEPNGISSFVDSPSAFQELASPRRTFAARGAWV